MEHLLHRLYGVDAPGHQQAVITDDGGWLSMTGLLTQLLREPLADISHAFLSSFSNVPVNHFETFCITTFLILLTELCIF